MMSGKLFILTGKSSTGKDTLLNQLVTSGISIARLVPYTTRPKREGEEEGREYHFVESIKGIHGAIDVRTYHTMDGDWSYAVAVSAADLEDGHKIVIGTLETVVRAREVLGNARVVPIYLEVSDRVRLSRAISREELSSKPNYYEVCRRFLDEKDTYSDDKLIMSGIMRKHRFYNDNLAGTLHEVEEFIRANE